jgi:hypothetical protein
MASINGLDAMSDFYDTEWAIMAGLDRTDAAKVREGGARTILTIIAKGLTGSRSNPNVWKIAVPEYVYILLCLANIGDHSLDNLKKVLVTCHEEYEGIDKVCSERWGAWDLAAWAEETITCDVELLVASYDRQLSGFTNMYTLVTEGRFKSPFIGVMGAKVDDIMVEEMTMFDHDADRKWFGCPEKKYNLIFRNDDTSVRSSSECLWEFKWMNIHCPTKVR